MPVTGHWTRQDIEDYESVKTYEDVVAFGPNLENRATGQISASRLPNVLAMLHTKLPYSSAISDEEVHDFCEDIGVSEHPPYFVAGKTLVCPFWLSKTASPPFLKSLAQITAETRWKTDVPEVEHQALFVNHTFAGETMAHAGVGILTQQHKTEDNGKQLTYFEPLMVRKPLPEVVRDWGVQEGLSCIRIITGKQRAGTKQCIRKCLDFYRDFVLTNQHMELRGASRIYNTTNGRYQPLPRRRYPVRMMPRMPERLLDSIMPATTTVAGNAMQPVVVLKRL